MDQFIYLKKKKACELLNFWTVAGSEICPFKLLNTFGNSVESLYFILHGPYLMALT